MFRIDRSDEQIREKGDEEEGGHERHSRVVDGGGGIDGPGRGDFHELGDRHCFGRDEGVEVFQRGMELVQELP